MTQQNLADLSLPENRRWRLLANTIWVGLLLALLACVGLGAATSLSIFQSSNSALNLIQAWLIPALIVPPMALIIARGGVDLSAGAVAGLVATVMAAQLTTESAGVGLALLLGLLLAVLIGLINGFLTGATRIHGAIITLGMMTLLNGLTFTISGGPLIVAQEVGFLSSLTLPIIALILSIILAIAWIEFTPFGRSFSVKPDNGGPWWQRLFWVGTPYVWSSLMAGLAGAWLLGRLRAAGPTIGISLEVDVILMVLLGGTPPGKGLVNIVGGVVAAFLVSVAQHILTLNQVSAPSILVGKGAILLIFALLSYLYYQLINRVFRGRQAVSPPLEGADSALQRS